MPKGNSLWRNSPSATSKWGLNREGRAALLRVGTGPECPEDNLRELTKHEIARERGEREREREKLSCEKL